MQKKYIKSFRSINNGVKFYSLWQKAKRLFLSLFFNFLGKLRKTADFIRHRIALNPQSKLHRFVLSNGVRIVLTSLIAAFACTGIIYAATTVGTNISTGGTLDVTGATTFTTASSTGIVKFANINSDTGAISFGNENLSTTGTLNITGLTTLGNASTTVLSVSGNTYITGILSITGNSIFTTASSTGIVKFSQINSDTGAISFGDENLTTTGTLNITGLTTLGNASTTVLSVSGNSYLATTTLTGDLTVSGRAVIGNSSTAVNILGIPAKVIDTSVAPYDTAVDSIGTETAESGFASINTQQVLTYEYFVFSLPYIIRQSGCINKVRFNAGYERAWDSISSAGESADIRFWHRNEDDTWTMSAEISNIQTLVQAEINGNGDTTEVVTLDIDPAVCGVRSGDIVSYRLVNLDSCIDGGASQCRLYGAAPDANMADQGVDNGTNLGYVYQLLSGLSTPSVSTASNFTLTSDFEDGANAPNVEFFMEEAPQIVFHGSSLMCGGAISGAYPLRHTGYGISATAPASTGVDTDYHPTTPLDYHFAQRTGLTYQTFCNGGQNSTSHTTATNDWSIQEALNTNPNILVTSLGAAAHFMLNSANEQLYLDAKTTLKTNMTTTLNLCKAQGTYCIMMGLVHGDDGVALVDRDNGYIERYTPELKAHWEAGGGTYIDNLPYMYSNVGTASMTDWTADQEMEVGDVRESTQTENCDGTPLYYVSAIAGDAKTHATTEPVWGNVCSPTSGTVDDDTNVTWKFLMKMEDNLWDINPGYDAGDDLHINAEGYEIMALAVENGIRNMGAYAPAVYGELQTNTVELTSAEIIRLVGSPKTVIAAQGEDTWIEVVSALVVMDAATNYVAVAGADLMFEYSGGQDITIEIDENNFIDGNADEARYTIVDTTVFTDEVDVVALKNQSVQLINTGAVRAISSNVDCLDNGGELFISNNTSHGLSVGQAFIPTDNTGAVCSPLVSGTTYYVESYVTGTIITAATKVGGSPLAWDADAGTAFKIDAWDDYDTGTGTITVKITYRVHKMGL